MGPTGSSVDCVCMCALVHTYMCPGDREGLGRVLGWGMGFSYERL